MKNAEFVGYYHSEERAFEVYVPENDYFHYWTYLKPIGKKRGKWFYDAGKDLLYKTFRSMNESLNDFNSRLADKQNREREFKNFCETYKVLTPRERLIFLGIS